MAALYPILSGDQGLVLGREQFIRRMSIGYNWSWLRIGVRGMVYCNSGYFVGSFRIGLTTALRQFDAPDADMVYVDHGTMNTWQCNLNNFGNHCAYWSPADGFQVKLGATVTNGVFGTNNQSDGGQVYCSFGLYPTRFLALVDIWRNGTTLTGRAYNKAQNSQGPTIADVSQEAFFNDLESATPSLMGTFYNPGGANGGATNYAGAGLLDSIYLHWRTNAPMLIINDLAVCRYS